MTEFFYSPHTGEIINPTVPADWMGTTNIKPPVFDSQTQGAFFRNGAWVVITAQPKVIVPQAVTMRQARLALLQAGLLATVNTAIAAMPGAAGEAARIEWEYAQEVRRDAPLIAGMQAALALTATQIDELFIAAARL